MQPAWLYLDTPHAARRSSATTAFATSSRSKASSQAGVIVGGGSDHMQKIGSLRSINPYNPFLGMWVAITRRAIDVRQAAVNPEEALTREQAIRFYTINNAQSALPRKRGSARLRRASRRTSSSSTATSCTAPSTRSATFKHWPPTSMASPSSRSSGPQHPCRERRQKKGLAPSLRGACPFFRRIVG